MKTLWMMLVVVLGFFGITQQAWATKAYVTDSFEITLRTGPSNENFFTLQTRGRSGVISPSATGVRANPALTGFYCGIHSALYGISEAIPHAVGYH